MVLDETATMSAANFSCFAPTPAAAAVPALSSHQTPTPPSKTLLDLSDDLLLKILSHVNSGDLLRLTRTCSRLAEVAADWSLWVKVDTGAAVRLTARELEEIMPFLHEKTKSVMIYGLLPCSGYDSLVTVTPTILRTIARRCPNLEKFALKDCFMDGRRVRLQMFPACVKILRISGCSLCNIGLDNPNHSFFEGIHTHFPQLVALDLSSDYGLFVKVNDHLLIGKCQGLRALSFKGCFNVGLCDALGSSMNQFIHFKNLVIADFRDIANVTFLIGSMPALTHLYLGYTEPSRRRIGGMKDVVDAHLHILIERSFHQKTPVRLQILGLTYTDVTDGLMTKLAQQFPLRYLNLIGSRKVTQVGVEAVRSKRPQCTVVWEGPRSALDQPRSSGEGGKSRDSYKNRSTSVRLGESPNSKKDPSSSSAEF